MKKIATLLLFVIAIFSSRAQVEVYKTYDDYKNNTPVHYADYKKIKIAGTGADYIFVDDKSNDVTINTKDMWGFKYKDVTFRFFKLSSEGAPVAIINIGKVIYYENGYAYLKSLKKDKETITIDKGHNYFFSATLESDVYGGNKISRFYEAKGNEKYDELYKLLIENISYKFLPKKVLNDEVQMKAYRYNESMGLEMNEIRKVIMKYENIDKLTYRTIDWKTNYN